MVDPSINIIWKYFDPSPSAKSQLEKLGPLYAEINQRVNVISRRDIESLYLHHVLHSLSLMKLNRFFASDHILDLGTGGGFPGIPLAIMYPECQFTLIDGTHKKIQIVNTIIQELGLANVTAIATRSEYFDGSFDFVVSRAVAAAPKIWQWCKHLLPPKTKKSMKTAHPNIFLLKGGDLTEELKAFPFKYTLYPIHLYFEEEYFREKFILAF